MLTFCGRHLFLRLRTENTIPHFKPLIQWTGLVLSQNGISAWTCVKRNENVRVDTFTSHFKKLSLKSTLLDSYCNYIKTNERNMQACLVRKNIYLELFNLFLAQKCSSILCFRQFQPIPFNWTFSWDYSIKYIYSQLMSLQSILILFLDPSHSLLSFSFIYMYVSSYFYIPDPSQLSCPLRPRPIHEALLLVPLSYVQHFFDTVNKRWAPMRKCACLWPPPKRWIGYGPAVKYEHVTRNIRNTQR